MVNEGLRDGLSFYCVQGNSVPVLFYTGTDPPQTKGTKSQKMAIFFLNSFVRGHLLTFAPKDPGKRSGARRPCNMNNARLGYFCDWLGK
jgi:hypothetical protein